MEVGVDQGLLGAERNAVWAVLERAVREEDMAQVENGLRRLRESARLRQTAFYSNLPARLLSRAKGKSEFSSALFRRVRPNREPQASILRFILHKINGDQASAERIVARFEEKAAMKPLVLRALRVWNLYFSLERLDAEHLSEMGTGGPYGVPVIQFWDKKILPTDVQMAVCKWIELFGLHRHRLFDDASAVNFLEDEFGSEMVKVYLSSAHAAGKADLFRLCYLLRHGGMYADADSFPRSNVSGLSELAGARQVCVFRSDLYFNRITNYFIYSPQDYGLIATALQRSQERLASGHPSTIFETTGPGVLSDAAVDFLSSRQRRERVLAVAAADCSRFLMRQFKANYKNDERNWKLARA